MVFNKDFWNNRYLNNETGWDTKNIVPPIKEYIDQLDDKNLKILVPGAGNAYEVEYLFKKHFRNVHLLEWSTLAVKNFKNRLPNFPNKQILILDFFELKGTFDLILEYTFFCALGPKIRSKYVDKMYELLEPNGKLVGVLFDWDKEDGPPFGGNIAEYQNLFESKFSNLLIEPCYNSILPRAGREVFIKAIKNA